MTHQAVGFTVADASLAGHNSGDVIKFPSILYNEGDHFNRDTGIFTCPVTGMYNLHVALRSHSTSAVAASIIYEHYMIVGLVDEVNRQDSLKEIF